MAKFLKQHPGAVSTATVRRAWMHTYNSRGFYYRTRDLVRSTRYYFRSLKVQPAQIAAFRGLAGNVVAAFRGQAKES